MLDEEQKPIEHWSGSWDWLHTLTTVLAIVTAVVRLFDSVICFVVRKRKHRANRMETATENIRSTSMGGSSIGVIGSDIVTEERVQTLEISKDSESTGH